MNIPKFIFFLILLGASLYYAYTPWFHPEKYLGNIKKQRRQIEKGKTRFLPQVSTFKYLNSHTGVDIWLARVTSIIGVLICIVALLAVLAGAP